MQIFTQIKSHPPTVKTHSSSGHLGIRLLIFILPQVLWPLGVGNVEVAVSILEGPQDWKKEENTEEEAEKEQLERQEEILESGVSGTKKAIGFQRRLMACQ